MFMVEKINQIHWVNGEHFIHQAIYTTFGFGSLALNIKLLIRNVIHIEKKKSFDPRLMLLCSRVWNMKRLQAFLGFRLKSNI